MILHCPAYWKEMARMLKNLRRGVFPIDTGCPHPRDWKDCPACAALNGGDRP